MNTHESSMANEIVVIEKYDESHYELTRGDTDNQLVASLDVDGTSYSILVPSEMNKGVILADKRRSSRTSGIERLIDSPLEYDALVNRSILLIAFDAYENGELPKPAWDKFRVAVTRVHDELMTRGHQSDTNFSQAEERSPELR